MQFIKGKSFILKWVIALFHPSFVLFSFHPSLSSTLRLNKLFLPHSARIMVKSVAALIFFTSITSAMAVRLACQRLNSGDLDQLMVLNPSLPYFASHEETNSAHVSRSMPLPPANYCQYPDTSIHGCRSIMGVGSEISICQCICSEGGFFHGPGKCPEWVPRAWASLLGP